MSLAFGFALFVVGFAMLMAGVGLLIGGEMVFKSGKKITKPVGRKASIAFLSFFPLFAVVHFALGKIDPNPVVPIAAVSWPLAVGCLGLGCPWLSRGMAASKSQPRYTLVPVENVLDAAAAHSSEPIVLEVDSTPEMKAPPTAATGKRSGPPSRGQSPFDFS